MNAPDRLVRPKASRRVPGVKVPVAAPSWAVDLTSVASWRSVRPCADGNCPVEGCSAAGSSATAGGSAAVEAVDVVLAGAELERGAGAPDEEEEEVEEPQPAIANAARTGTRNRA